MPLSIGRFPQTKQHHNVLFLLLFAWSCLLFNNVQVSAFSLRIDTRRTEVDRPWADTQPPTTTEEETRRILRTGQRFCEPLIIPNASVEDSDQNDIIPGTKLAVTCDNGYVLHQTSIRFVQCQQSGTWSGYDGTAPTKKLPKCIATECDVPIIIKNGNVKLDEQQIPPHFPVGYHVVYICDPGYKLHGYPIRTCAATRKWYPQQPPTCIKEKETPTTSTTPEPPPKTSKSSLIMQLLLYISIPLLLILGIAIACNIRSRVKKAKTTREANGRNAANEFPPTAPHPTTSSPLLGENLIAAQLRSPTNTSDTDDSECLPPSYEDVIRQDRPPSFNTVQRSTAYRSATYR